MTENNKQISNPFSTGGGGTNFETRVQACFVTMMLCGGFAPCLPAWPIKKIKLQGKYAGYDTDDAIIFVENPDSKKERRLLCQIKHSVKFTQNNMIFRKVIQDAWNDFNNTKVFTQGTDSIALITGPLSATDIADVRFVLEQARCSESPEDFLTKVDLIRFSSSSKKKKKDAFRKQLKNSHDGIDISNDEFWQFMKSFNLLGYDLDVKAGVTLSLIQSLIYQYSPGNAQNLWTQIVYEVQSGNQSSGTITLDSLPEEIRAGFQKPGVKRIPANLGIKPSSPAVINLSNRKLAIANLLGGWDENV